MSDIMRGIPRTTLSLIDLAGTQGEGGQEPTANGERHEDHEEVVHQGETRSDDQGIAPVVAQDSEGFLWVRSTAR